MEEPVKVPRNMSLRYEDHKGLIYRLAMRYHKRILASKIPGVEFDDVLGECNVAFVKATRGFKADRGFTFTAFMGRVVQNHFNHFAERLSLEHFGQTTALDLDDSLEFQNKTGLGYVSVQDLDFEGDPYEAMEDATYARPEEVIDARMTINNVLRDVTLSPLTRAYIALVVDPHCPVPDATKEKIRNAQASVRLELSLRWDVKIPTIRL